MLIAPSEPAPLRALGTVSDAPERHGSDFMWVAQGRLVGCQRKEFNDLLASVRDGRLAKESSQMQRLHIPMLLVEGQPNWTIDGRLLNQWANWTKDQYQALLWSIQARGIWVAFTTNMTETIHILERFKSWTEKDSHATLFTRPKAPSAWGQRGDEDTQLWILQSVDGLGPERARAILNHFGHLPIGWKIEKSALLEVPGLGPKTVERIWELFNEDTRTHAGGTPAPKSAPASLPKSRKKVSH